MLPERSLDREFASQELKPGLDALRHAYENRQGPEAQHAYHLLETRVENYELGLPENPEDISQEAKEFLDTYRPFTSFK